MIFCSGKIYYDLLETQKSSEKGDVALVRVEQLYPTPVDQMEAIYKRYKNAKEVVWVQEEPENMGAWPYLLRRLRQTELSHIDVISRKESSSTATGYAKQHANQQAYIVSKAFDVPVTEKVKAIVAKASKKLVNID
ncbi:2-oxoglutarate dehydrogenase E1 component [compost metagenome]